MAINLCLGNRGYTVVKESISTSVQKSIKQELTVKAYVNEDYSVPSIPFPIYCESKKKVYLPRFYGIQRFGIPDLNKLHSGTKINITFKGKLRDKQLPIIDAYMNAINEEHGGGGIISVPCGYGKTVLALHILSKLGVKTLVVVHKEFLLNQWKERIEEFLPDARVGRIQGPVKKVNDKDIVIGMLQSISMIDYDESIFSDFGFVIYDECHHLGAEVFSRALLKTGFKYLLGLSATPKRSDGLSKVFEWFLGPMVYSIKKREEEKVKVKVIDYFNSDEKYSKEVLNYNMKPCLPNMINNITAYPERMDLLLNEINACLKDSRKILVLSDRRDHLKTIKYYLDKNETYTCGFYLGGMKQKELEVTEKADVILGTFSMASEGFDCKYPLNTIILASPKSSIEQAVGRILRQEEKYRTKVPLIIDINDNFSLFARQTQKRIAFYKKNNYTIERYDKHGKLKETKHKSKIVAPQDLQFLD
jgi:superfamily II DNA or RNA helicase